MEFINTYKVEENGDKEDFWLIKESWSIQNIT